MAAFATDKPATIVQGRECGKCSLCCKVVAVKEIEKPAGAWCKQCAPGKAGCKIYETRPEACRGFQCMWKLTDKLGPDWYPANAKFVVLQVIEGNRIAICVDPAYPARWREQPYFSMIQHWARVGVEVARQVVVYVGKKATVVLPNKTVDLGEVEPEDHIMVGILKVPPGRPPDWTAWVRKAADIPEEERNSWNKTRFPD